MRRILALFTLIAIVGTACSSDQSETTITDPAGAIAVPDATSGTQEPPTVNLASGGTNVESTDQRSLVPAFGNSITLNIPDTVAVIDGQVVDSIDPDPGRQTALWLSSPRWRIESFGGAECAIANGQIVVSAPAADFLGLARETAESFESYGNLGGQEMVLARVDPGTELEVILEAIEVGGLASFHYPVFPQPRWNYGPASDPLPISLSDQISKAIGTTGDPVYVIDYFGADAPREVADEIDAYGKLYDVAFDGDELAEFTEGLEEADANIRGHGEFIGGILDRLGVAWQFEHVKLTGDRVNDETSIKIALASNLTTDDGEDLAITNLSMGIEPCEVTWKIDGQALLDSDGGPTLITMPPHGITAAMSERAQEFSGRQTPVDSFVVAAAGNHGDSSACVAPWFPARFAAGMSAWSSYYDAIQRVRALPEVVEVLPPNMTVNPEDLDVDIAVLQGSTISVGASAVPDPESGDANRATFSACNDAGITVFAPGTNIISDYHPALAVWSGTSFATPQVAGAIARGLYAP